MHRAVEVRLSGIPAGILAEDYRGTRFTYLPEWLDRPGATPVSLTLPLRPEPYFSRGLHPFFENLLPEGWLLELTSKTLKISKDDEFGLLAATCGDCIGDVEVVPFKR
jgi:serine/threonine-protein kinase HipA